MIRCFGTDHELDIYYTLLKGTMKVVCSGTSAWRYVLVAFSIPGIWTIYSICSGNENVPVGGYSLIDCLNDHLLRMEL